MSELRSTSCSPPMSMCFFDSEAIVFEHLSSSLHLLSTLNGELLLLAVEGATTQQLIDKVINDYAIDNDQAADFVDQTLNHYKSLGLIDG